MPDYRAGVTGQYLNSEQERQIAAHLARRPQQAGVLDGLRGAPAGSVRARAQGMMRDLPPMTPPGDEMFRQPDIEIDVPAMMNDAMLEEPQPLPHQQFPSAWLGRPMPKDPPKPQAYVGRHFGRG